MKPNVLSLSTAERTEPGPRGLSAAELVLLVDALIDVYVSWREECAAVAGAYEDWTAAEPGDRKLAYGAYVAALDREEKAATTYRGLVAQIADVHGALSASATRSGGARRAAATSVVPWSPRSIAARLWRL
jgi:hypothetical protein